MSQTADPELDPELVASAAELDESLLLAELGRVGSEISTAKASLDRCYPWRRLLFQRGKELGITNRVLGEASGCDENAVVAVLRKARLRDAG